MTVVSGMVLEVALMLANIIRVTSVMITLATHANRDGSAKLI